MKTLVLVSKTPIVIQIFNLIAKKLHLELEVISSVELDHKVDIVVVEKSMVDDNFNSLKTQCKLIGTISNDPMPFELANDFLIPNPFLPSTLQELLEVQIQELEKRAKAKVYATKIDHINEPIEDDTTEVSLEQLPNNEADIALDYIDSLASNIAHDVKEDIDDSIVHISSVEKTLGGVLDQHELSKLEDIIDYSTPKLENVANDDTSTDDDEQWMDLSSIIDKAIDELNTTDKLYDKLEIKPIKLLLNDYSMNELKPLFELLNQDIIDAIADGQEIILQLKLES